MRKRAEQRLVEQFVAQAAVETFDEGVLLRLARGDVMPLDAGLLRPAQDRHAGQLGAVVGDTGGRLATPGHDRVELTPDPQAGERGVGDQRQAFAGEVVDDGEDAKAPAVAQLVMQKVERPALVGTLRHGQRCPGAERPLATAATADLKPFLDIEAAQLLVIQHDALAPQQDAAADSRSAAERRQSRATGSE